MAENTLPAPESLSLAPPKQQIAQHRQTNSSPTFSPKHSPDLEDHMAENTLPAPESLSYEAARDELIAIVKTLESGQAPLEDTLAMWERGEALATRCRSILDAATQPMEQGTDN